MNAEQKKRIAHEISNWKNACNCRAVQLAGDRMAALLNELLAATNPAQISSLAEPQPPAPSVPVAHPDDIAVDHFAAAMKTKMAKSRAVGRYGWDDPAVCTAEDLRLFLVNHIAKGDPVDVGNFAMMLFNRGETTATKHRPEPTADVVRDAARYRWLRNEAWGCHVASKGLPHVVEFKVGMLPSMVIELAEDALDAAIDAAIGRQGGE